MSAELKNELAAILKPVGQEHLLRFWDKLNAEQQGILSGQIKSVDWPAVIEWVRTAGEGFSSDVLEKLQPAAYKAAVPSNEDERELYDRALEHGISMLKAGQVAAFTVAGGQGSRLGYDGPKGTYRVSQLKQKSLFQLFAEGLIRNQKKYGKVIPWYIMTSNINDMATREFFRENDFFGLDEGQIMFFAQGMLPAFDIASGKALMDTCYSLALSPNGHGGSFAALKDSGALDDMKRRGIKAVSYWQVDNPLIKQCDPLFLGLHDILGSDMSSKALIKRDAGEKLGHFCILDGRLIIIEYSDMPESLLYRTEEDGRLAFRAGSPAMHVISPDFIERITGGKLDFMPHRALKKVAHIDEDGNSVKPSEPNAVKLEFFLFDALPLANAPLVFEGCREDEFAPVKNAEGQDSPESCRRLMLEKAVRMLEGAGISFPRTADGQPDAVVELSPALFGCSEDVRENISMIPEIRPGDSVYIG